MGCGNEGRIICSLCLEKIRPKDKQFCLMCGHVAFFGITCPPCKNQKSCDGLFTAFDYADMKQLIIEGKYNFVSETFRILGKAIPSVLTKELPKYFENFTVCSVPLSKSRERWRGFNQSKILSEAFALEMGLPYSDLLTRHKTGKVQKELDKKSRVLNMKDAFSLKAGACVSGLSVILIDDVVTTGSTLREATSVLKKHGASEVWCITLARD